MLSCGVSPGSSRLPPAADRPVVVLARAVDAGERLLVQQAGHAVLLGHARQRLHDQLLVVGREVGVFVDRRDLVLAGATSLCRVLTGTPSLKSSRSRRACRPARARGSRRSTGLRTPDPWAAWHRRACDRRPSAGRGGRRRSCGRSGSIPAPGPTRPTPGDVLVAEELEHARACLSTGLHRAQQRRLLVERFAGPRARRPWGCTERGAVRVFEDVGGAGRIPRGVAAGLERGAEAARGEARRVRLALDQFLAGELGDGVAGRRSA
jgi:hypothetical protein